jgi:DNA primase
LLEYGLRNWNDEISIAQHIFNELEQYQFDNSLIEKLFNEYRQAYINKEEPTTKSFYIMPMKI